MKGERGSELEEKTQDTQRALKPLTPLVQRDRGSWVYDLTTMNVSPGRAPLAATHTLCTDHSGPADRPPAHRPLCGFVWDGSRQRKWSTEHGGGPQAQSKRGVRHRPSACGRLLGSNPGRGGWVNITVIRSVRQKPLRKVIASHSGGRRWGSDVLIDQSWEGTARSALGVQFELQSTLRFAVM